jgi:hypothetical protein
MGQKGKDGKGLVRGKRGEGEEPDELQRRCVKGRGVSDRKSKGKQDFIGPSDFQTW